MRQVNCDTCHKTISEIGINDPERISASDGQCIRCYANRSEKSRAKVGDNPEIGEQKLTLTESGYHPVSPEAVIAMGADEEEVGKFTTEAQPNDWRIFDWVVGLSLDDF